MPAAYPDFSWSTRAARLLVVISAAALAGTVFGGVCVYLIDDALTDAPRSTTADAGKNSAIESSATPLPAQPTNGPAASALNAQAKPIRMIDPSLPAPTIVAKPTPTLENIPSVPPKSGPAPRTGAPGNPVPPDADLSASVAAPSSDVQARAASQNAQAAPSTPGKPAQLARTPWPDAPFRAHQSSPDAPVPEKETAGSATVRTTKNGMRSSAQIVSSPPLSESGQTNEDKKSARNAYPTKKRVEVTRQTQPGMAEADNPSLTPRQRQIYDYYGDRDRDGGDADDTSREAIKTQPGVHTSARADVRELRAYRGAINGRPPLIVRRRQDQQGKEQDDSDDQTDQTSARPRSVLPQQPSPAWSFLGGFFGDHSHDSD
jgi:hypothetical protein